MTSLTPKLSLMMLLRKAGRIFCAGFCYDCVVVELCVGGVGVVGKYVFFGGEVDA